LGEDGFTVPGSKVLKFASHCWRQSKYLNQPRQRNLREAKQATEARLIPHKTLTRFYSKLATELLPIFFRIPKFTLDGMVAGTNSLEPNLCVLCNVVQLGLNDYSVLQLFALFHKSLWTETSEEF
jgi:hypothetical protein